MEQRAAGEASKLATSGRRKVTPRVCIADAKRHVRTFLGESFGELGFVASECAQAGEVAAVLKKDIPDLVVVGPSGGGAEAGEVLKSLAAGAFDGKVLLLGPRESLMIAAVREVGEQLGVAMLPALHTPFRHEDLRETVRGLLPDRVMPNPPVDVAEALHAGWLELWYQPKIDIGMLALSGAEALIRIRHPIWGLVPPSSPPDETAACFRALSEFVVDRAIEDWHDFSSQHGPVEIAINLPIAFLEPAEAVSELCQRLPDQPAFERLLIEINGVDLIRNLETALKLAKELALTESEFRSMISGWNGPH